MIHRLSTIAISDPNSTKSRMGSLTGRPSSYLWLALTSDMVGLLLPEHINAVTSHVLSESR